MNRLVVVDPDGTLAPYLGVIIQHPTGVLYEQQCGGTECLQRQTEGYYVPLGGAQANPENGPFEIAVLTRPFHKGHGCCFGGSPSPREPRTPSLPPERLTLLRASVESIRYWYQLPETPSDDQVTNLRLDDSRILELVEAWVPVLTPDGPGILTWPNCD